MNPVVSQTDSFVNQLNWHTNQSTKALEQLASGTRLLAPQDDAAGLAVATKLEAQLRQFDAAARNLANATSFTQTQDGYLKSAQGTLDRMGELAIRAQDATLSPDQRALYQTEFQALKTPLTTPALPNTTAKPSLTAPPTPSPAAPKILPNCPALIYLPPNKTPSPPKPPGSIPKPKPKPPCRIS